MRVALVLLNSDETITQAPDSQRELIHRRLIFIFHFINVLIYIGLPLSCQDFQSYGYLSDTDALFVNIVVYLM